MSLDSDGVFKNIPLWISLYFDRLCNAIIHLDLNNCTTQNLSPMLILSTGYFFLSNFYDFIKFSAAFSFAIATGSQLLCLVHCFITTFVEKIEDQPILPAINTLVFLYVVSIIISYRSLCFTDLNYIKSKNKGSEVGRTQHDSTVNFMSVLTCAFSLIPSTRNMSIIVPMKYATMVYGCCKILETIFLCFGEYSEKSEN
jgi:hypothetical protein